MARPFRIGATGGLGCSSNPGQSPHLGDGTCRCQCAAGGPRSTTPQGVTELRVRPNPPALPKLFGTSSQAVDPQRSINVLGQVVPLESVHRDWLVSLLPRTAARTQERP